MDEQTGEKLKAWAIKSAQQRVDDAQAAFEEIEELLKMLHNQRQKVLACLVVANAELAKSIETG